MLARSIPRTCVATLLCFTLAAVATYSTHMMLYVDPRETERLQRQKVTVADHPVARRIAECYETDVSKAELTEHKGILHIHKPLR